MISWVVKYYMKQCFLAPNRTEYYALDQSEVEGKLFKNVIIQV